MESPKESPSSWSARHPWLVGIIRTLVVTSVNSAAPWIMGLAFATGVALWGFLANSRVLLFALGALAVCATVLFVGLVRWLVAQGLARIRHQLESAGNENARLRAQYETLEARHNKLLEEHDLLSLECSGLAEANEFSTAALDILIGLTSTEPRIYPGAERDRELERWLADTARRSLLALRPGDPEVGLGLVSRSAGQYQVVCTAGVPNRVLDATKTSSKPELRQWLLEDLDLPDAHIFPVDTREAEHRWLVAFANGPFDPVEQLLCKMIAAKIGLFQLQTRERVPTKALL
jgi:hypothetical protein